MLSLHQVCYMVFSTAMFVVHCFLMLLSCLSIAALSGAQELLCLRTSSAVGGCRGRTGLGGVALFMGVCMELVFEYCLCLHVCVCVGGGGGGGYVGETHGSIAPPPTMSVQWSHLVRSVR